MLPDLDHASASVLRALWPVTSILSAVVRAVSGGHRQGTHSLLGVVAFTILTWTITAVGPLATALGLAMLFSIGAAAMRIGPSGGVTQLMCCLLGGGALSYFGVTVPIPDSYSAVGIGPWQPRARGVATSAACTFARSISSHRGVGCRS